MGCKYHDPIRPCPETRYQLIFWSARYTNNFATVHKVTRPAHTIAVGTISGDFQASATRWFDNEHEAQLHADSYCNRVLASFYNGFGFERGYQDAMTLVHQAEAELCRLYTTFWVLITRDTYPDGTCKLRFETLAKPPVRIIRDRQFLLARVQGGERAKRIGEAYIQSQNPASAIRR